VSINSAGLITSLAVTIVSITDKLLKIMTRTISKLAKHLNISIETIRFYERKLLIQQPVKPAQGYRHYPDEIIDRIHFIKRAQELGFSLDEIANLLSLHDQPCDQVQALAYKKLIAVQEKKQSLLRLEEALTTLLKQCENNRNKDDCPIIDALQP
jgi:MerR family mercuric resistance operon transcriptional regulator